MRLSKEKAKTRRRRRRRRIALTIAISEDEFKFLEQCVALKKFPSGDEFIGASPSFYRKHLS